jgi:cytochrome b561
MSQVTGFQVSRYHPALVVLHWLMAFLIIAALALGALVMARIPNSDPAKIEALRSHMTGGVLILALMLTRLMLRARTAHPAPASAGHPRLDRLAWASHRLLYLLVLGMAASGIVMALEADLPDIVFAGRGRLPADFWTFAPRAFHYAFSRALMLLIALHVTGALYHAVIRRDGLLRRMSFGRRVIPSVDRNAPPFDPELSEVRR